MKSHSRKNVILILTSTFPRWKEDSVPAFVQHFAKKISDSSKSKKVYVLAPHYRGAKQKEAVDDIQVTRFRYMFPYKFEDIAYEGGVNKIKKNPFYLIKLVFFILSQFANSLLLIKKNRIDIVNAHWIIPQGFVAILCKKLTGVKTVVTIHGTDIFGLNGRLFKKFKKWVLTNADEVVVNSSATLQAAKFLSPKRKYHVIPMGVDMDKFPKTKRKTPNPNSFKLLFVGRLSEEKGVIYLLQALNIIKYSSPKLYKTLHLTVVGSGYVEDELKKYVQDNKLNSSVKFTGWVSFDNLPKLYENSDLFVGPSITTNKGIQEAFGLVFAESLAMNTPAIGTTSGGVKDIIKNNKNGYIVDEKSPEQLADRIKFLYENPEILKSMSENGRRYIENNFSWPIVIKRYEKVIF